MKNLLPLNDLPISKFFTIILLLIVSSFSYAQPAIEWEVTYGGSSLEAGHTIIPTSDGGYVVAASALSDDGDVGGNQGEYDYWIVKLDADGSLLWESNFGGGDDELVSDIIELSDGGFMVAGTTLSTDGDISVKYGPFLRDGWIVRLDADGNLLWDKTIGGTADDNPTSMIATPDDGALIAVTTRSMNIDVSVQLGMDDIWLVKLNSNGDIAWEKTFGGTEIDRPGQIVATQDGGYIISGWTESTDEFVSNNNGESDYWIFKINEIGEMQWEKNYGGSGIDRNSAIQPTLDGGFIVSGTSNSTDGDISNPNGSFDSWLIKIDSDGNLLWENSYGEIDAEFGLSVQSTPDGGYIFLSENEELVKIDGIGNEEWKLDIGVTPPNLFNLFFRVKNTPDGGYILSGSQGPNGNDQVLILKLEGNTTSNCPTDISGFTSLGEFNNSKYFISNEVAQPAAAQMFAEQNGGYLAVINSQAENDFIQQNISDMSYIGLNDVAMEGDLTWVNGDGLNFDNIDPCTFCNENSDDLDYVIIAPWDGRWSFSSQWNQRKYIVEVPCNPTFPSLITLNCPSDITVTADANTGLAFINYSDATGSTDCPNGGLSILNTGIIGPGTEVGVGVYTISFSGIDACGSTSECFFNITVEAGNMGGGCPPEIPEFTSLGEFGNSKYFISNENAQPADAQITAEANGGYLAVINDQAENDFIQQGIDEFAYIGLNDAQSEGNLTWVNGDALNFNNINPCGFCNENTPDLDYAMIQPWDGGWSFSSQWNQRKYIVEVPCGSSSGLVVDCGNPDTIFIDIPQNVLLGTAIYNEPTATTDCPIGGVTLNRVNGPASGFSNTYPGTHDVVYEITDACGNSELCVFTIFMVSFPYSTELICPPNITIQATSPDGAIVDYVEPSVVSDCPVPFSITNMSGPTSGSLFPIGTTTVEYFLVQNGLAPVCGEVFNCTFTITVDDGNSGGCPNDIAGFMTLGEFGNSKYFLSNEVASPLDAQIVAEANSGYLAVINNQAENDFIQQYISEMVYLGLNDVQIEGMPEWINGDPVNYTNFDICTFCNENSVDMDYVVMHHWNGGWSWSSQWNQRKYVIEIPCTILLTSPNNNNSIELSARNKNQLMLNGITPNPASDIIYFSLQSSFETKTTIQIFDARGMLVKTKQVALNKGINSIEESIFDLSDGIYFVKIPQENGEHISKRFVKLKE